MTRHRASRAVSAAAQAHGRAIASANPRAPSGKFLPRTTAVVPQTTTPVDPQTTTDAALPSVVVESTGLDGVGRDRAATPVDPQVTSVSDSVGQPTTDVDPQTTTPVAPQTTTDRAGGSAGDGATFPWPGPIATPAEIRILPAPG